MINLISVNANTNKRDLIKTGDSKFTSHTCRLGLKRKYGDRKTFVDH